MSLRFKASALGLASLVSSGCADTPSSGGDGPPVEVGEQREIELEYVRFDVSNFEKRLTLDDLLRLPRDVRERLWLLDLDLSNGPNSPRLIDNALAAVRDLDPESLAPAERNMQALLTMTPDTANLEGSSFESIIDLAPLLGVAPERVLADLFARDVEDAFLDNTSVAEAVVEQVVATHPNAQTRLGPRTADNPDGVYPVTPGALPVTMTDLITNFASYEKRFGAYDANGFTHPGFIGKVGAGLVTEDFAITVRANANALPFRGVDLTNVGAASVSSVRSQISNLFDFEDPNWMQVDGLMGGEPNIESLSFRIVEHPTFVAGGLSPVPAGIGNSEAWELPPYVLERVVIRASQEAFFDLDTEIAYTAPGQMDPLFQASVVEGFQQISVRGGIGSPPQPSYVWDSLLEVAQVRLHDEGLEEGEADVQFTLNEVPLGTTTAELIDTVKENLRADPRSLLQLTERILASASGEPDFYYYRARDDNADALRGDWLFFITPDDITRDDEGEPERPYGYAEPGFFNDPEVTQKVSSTVALDGDTEHEKVRLDDHGTLYARDAKGSVFRIRRREKPSQSRIVLAIDRIR